MSVSLSMSDHPSSWIVLTNCNDFSLISSTQKEEESYNLSDTNSELHESSDVSIKNRKKCASLYVSKNHLYMLEEIFLNNMYAIMMWWYILNDCNLWLLEKFRNYMVNKYMVNG